MVFFHYSNIVFNKDKIHKKNIRQQGVVNFITTPLLYKPIDRDQFLIILERDGNIKEF